MPFKKNQKRAQSVRPLPPIKSTSLLDGIPQNLPSLLRASRITQKVSEVGFDWPDHEGILAKLDEEVQELKEALSKGDRKKIREEFGDLLFVLVNLARFIRIDPENALNTTIDKFISRFHYIETSLRKKGKNLLQSELIEMEGLWEEAKKREKEIVKLNIRRH